ncbi:MAG: MBOAT family protein [Candidatus Eremiobacteraeota bacterium]|nr:MBOAT family protein [Candidatus Eremiobacteraeota bacterium]
MLFNTWSFALFAIFAIAIFAIVPPRYRAYWLIFSGVAFYASAGPKYLILMLGLTLATYGAARLMVSQSSERRRMAITVAAICLLIGVLIYFKYSRWILASLGFIAHTQYSARLGALLIPLAISFFTFEFVHFIIEVHRGHIRRFSLRDFATFALFFPTMVAGPIKRYGLFSPQLGALRLAGGVQAQGAIYRIGCGLFKKLVIADSAHLFLQPISNPEAGYTALANALAMVAATITIYYDFSGYSDIAIGFAMLFGVGVPENFARPFYASNIVEFWHRWHMSLTSWVRDYVFIPIGRELRGGERSHSTRARLVAIGMSLVVMIIIGLWHGAGWHYAVWGLWNGITLAVYYLWRQLVVPQVAYLKRGNLFLDFASIALTDLSFIIGMPLIGAPSTHDAFSIYRSLF